MQTYQAIQRILPSRLREGVRDLADAAFPNQRGWRHTIRVSMKRLDDEYERGRWDYLKSLDEMSRYAVIVGYCRYGGDVSSVLDLGCGSGVLCGWLRPLGTIDYVGVDLSNVAIDAARQEWTDGSTDFTAMDIATYVPDRKFDVIIFNEVLYYFEQPGDILARFAGFLEENGHFVISLWDAPESRLTWRRSCGSVRVVDAVQTRHSSGLSWQIRLCRPRFLQPRAVSDLCRGD
jgi:2-polyprenyl-6-hydroxyphenyl methylase/3-demethylubiquinone-9 3-methyltransferase